MIRQFRRRSGPILTILTVAATWARAGDGDAIAVINGQPLGQQKLVQALIDARGFDILQQLILVDLAKQEAGRRGLRVSPSDVELEYRAALDQIGKEAGLDENATKEQKMQALKMVLKQKRLSLAEFMLTMERNANLRKAVEQDLKITDATLREEFARNYGERVVVRHIQLAVSDSKAVNEVVEQLSRGADFGELARRYSVNRQSADNGGELEPFTFDDPNVPAALREAAFALREKEISPPIKVELMCHILRLEKRIAPQNVNFEDVRDQVLVSLRAREAQRLMNQLAQELYKKARIQILNASLKEQFDEFARENPEMVRQP